MSYKTELKAHPHHVNGLYTGLSGLVVGTVAAYASTYWNIDPLHRTIGVLAATIITMFTLDLLVFRAASRSTTLSGKPVNDWNWKRIATKLLSLATVSAILSCVYFWATPEYARSFYDPFRGAILLTWPWLALIAPLYIAVVDRRQVEPEDAYVQLWPFLLRQAPLSPALKTFFLGWLVKGFFLPIMFVFLHYNLEEISASQLLGGLNSFSNFYDLMYDTFYMWDVLLAVVGYVLTLKLLNSEIRSVDATVSGWLVCLLCYPPFWSAIVWNYLNYDGDDLYWSSFTSHDPIIYTVWGSAILLLLVVYVLATTAFGTRFSNLTNRGIIVTGPFRWVKHPAYLSKNISWWLISVPFLSSGDWGLAARSCLLLACVNVIYLLRARTEERHLSQDPAYVEYSRWVEQNGLFARFRRLVAGTIRGAKATSSSRRRQNFSASLRPIGV